MWSYPRAQRATTYKLSGRRQNNGKGKGKGRISWQEEVRRAAQSMKDREANQRPIRPKAKPRPKKSAAPTRKNLGGSTLAVQRPRYALTAVPQHRLYTRLEHIRAHEFFSVPMTAMGSQFFLFWPNNDMRSAIMINDAVTFSNTETVGAPASTPVNTYVDTNSQWETAAGNRRSVRPTPMDKLGMEPSRVLGGVFRIRFTLGPNQSLTTRYMPLDNTVKLNDVRSLIMTSDFATTIQVKSKEWYNVKPEFADINQARLFKQPESRPGEDHVTYYAMSIIFMNAVSPNVEYAGNVTVEVDAWHSIEHRLPDELKHHANTNSPNEHGHWMGFRCCFGQP